jgi:hypothetical protein
VWRTLFAIGMQTFTALFSLAVKEHLISPIPGMGALQRVSIYADDVVLFVRPLNSDLQAIKEILQMFWEASGLRVKSTINPPPR